MELLWTAFAMLKYILLACFLYMLKLLYEFIYLPWRTRQIYKKYPNVLMSEKYYPLLSDLKLIDQNVRQGKSSLYHHFVEAKDNVDKDIRIVQFGEKTYFNILSVKGLDEFEKLVPKYIDRHDQIDLPIGNLAPGSITASRTDESWKERRKHLASLIGINQCSKYIGRMVNA